MNRKYDTLSLILLTCSALASGQFPSGFGLKAGMAVANQSWRISEPDYTFDTEALITPTVVLFLEALKGEHFSFQLDAAYVVKGSASHIESVSVRHLEGDVLQENTGKETRSRFTYISLSPMARYRFDLGRLLPYLLLGPRMDILLDYSTDSEYPLESWKGYAVGLTAGAGLEYSFRKMHVFTEVQYQPDLSPVTNREPLLINNNVLGFMLGLRRPVSF
jgi:hypothetical protein